MPTLQETAIQCHKEGKLDEAELLYKGILSEQQDPQIAYLLGTIYFHKQRYDWARKHLEDVVATGPTPAAYCCLGHVYNKLNNFQKSYEAYLEASKQNPTYLEAWEGLVSALIKSGEAAQALEVTRTVKELEPNNYRIYILIGEAHEALGDLDAAVQNYHLAHESAPGSPEVQFNLGRAYLRQGKWDWAQTALDLTLASQPNHAEASLRLGEVYQFRKDYVKAEELYRKAHSLAPDDVDTLLILGTFFDMHARHSEALCFYTNAAKLQPDNPDVLQQLGHTLMNLGHEGKAEELFTRVLKIRPDSIRAHTDLCKIKYPGEEYYQILQNLHQWLKPKTYFEIGLRTGRSLAFAEKPTLCVGVDCEPFIVCTFHAPTRIFPITSDAFFADHNLKDCLDGNLVDMAFIDGLHVFEQVLRDFINTEKYSHQKTIVLFHDTLPLNDLIASPNRQTYFWAGDPWKIMPCLIKYRPDLSVASARSFPTGLGIVTGLDPQSTILEEKFDNIVAEFADAQFSDIKNPYESLNVIPNEWNEYQNFIKRSRKHTEPAI